MTDEEKLEYQEIGAWCRADDTIMYQAAAVFLSLSFGAVPLALQYPTTRVGLAFASIGLYIFWLAIATRLSWYSAVRLKRARELERKSGMAHHLSIHEPKGAVAREIGNCIHIKHVRLLFLFLLALAWVIVLCCACSSGNAIWAS